MINKRNLARSERFIRQANQASMPKCRVSFYFHASKRGGYCGTVYVKVGINGKDAQMSTGIFVENRKHWDSATVCIAGNESKTLLLRHLKTEIEAVYVERFVTDRSLDPFIILQVAAGLRTHDENVPTVLEGVDKWVNQYRERLHIDVTSSTLQTYVQYADRIKEFLAYQGYGSRLTFDDVKPAMAAELILYLKKKRQYSHNYAIKIVQFLRSAINYAIAYEWADRNPLSATRLRKEFREISALTEAQVQRIIDADFASTALEKARDLFVFQCFTGLAYADLRELSIGNLITTADGQLYIEKPRKKTSVVQCIPLLEPALAMLAKYQDDPCRKRGLLFPVPSNQKLNQYLKDIQDLLGIKEKIHTHLARKTCTTLFIVNGVPQATTCQVMGFSLQMMEKHYLSVRKDVILSDVHKAFQGKFTVHRNDEKPLTSQAL